MTCSLWIYSRYNSKSGNKYTSTYIVCILCACHDVLSIENLPTENKSKKINRKQINRTDNLTNGKMAGT